MSPSVMKELETRLLTHSTPMPQKVECLGITTVGAPLAYKLQTFFQRL